MTKVTYSGSVENLLTFGVGTALDEVSEGDKAESSELNEVSVVEGRGDMVADPSVDELGEREMALGASA